VTDNLTGLMWTKNANIWGTLTWNTAIDSCEGYSLAGYSDWRLPNRRELESLIDASRSSPALPLGHPFTGVQSSHYCSSSTDADNTPTRGAWTCTTATCTTTIRRTRTMCGPSAPGNEDALMLRHFECFDYLERGAGGRLPPCSRSERFSRV
jgi:hypothetical protein